MKKSLLLTTATFILLSCGLHAAPKEDGTIDKFIRFYFSSWSQRDFAGYGGCFHQRGVVSYVSKGDQAILWNARRFVAEQEEIQSVSKATEVPLKISIKSADEKSAFVVVEWELTDQTGSKKTGIDWFHLVRKSPEEAWKILYLSFWSHDTAKKPGG